MHVRVCFCANQRCSRWIRICLPPVYCAITTLSWTVPSIRSLTLFPLIFIRSQCIWRAFYPFWIPDLFFPIVLSSSAFCWQIWWQYDTSNDTCISQSYFFALICWQCCRSAALTNHQTDFLWPTMWLVWSQDDPYGVYVRLSYCEKPIAISSTSFSPRSSSHSLDLTTFILCIMYKLGHSRSH